MGLWPATPITELLGISLPILQAPMAGANLHELAIAVGQAGGLGALPCAMLDEAAIRREFGLIRTQGRAPLNLNFFCHQPPVSDLEKEAGWKNALRPYYEEFGLDTGKPVASPSRKPFDETMCQLVEELRPEVVSFHFGLPLLALLDRVRASGARIIASATTVEEARWLAQRGVDAVIAQGLEAGGHRGVFLQDEIYSQVGTFALLPQIVDAVDVPVIAAGGISDGRGIAAAFMLGACAVQIGTAYLFTPEAKVSPAHRAALRSRQAEKTALTNLFSGRPARGIVNRVMRELGPMSPLAPAFPLAGGALAPLKAATEVQGSGDFMSLWAGQAAPMGREMGAAELTRQLADDALTLLGGDEQG